VELFQKIAMAVEKINKQCILYLSPKKIQFIIPGDVTDGMQVWSSASVELLFDNYIIESINDRQIYFTVNCDNLNRALKSGLEASEIIMKLTKKNNEPFLDFTINKMSAHQNMAIVQDIPVELMTPAQIERHVEPHLDDPVVHIMMPTLRNVRNVVDRMKNISDQLTVKANMGGQLSFIVESSLITVETKYKNLDHPQIEGRPQQPRDPNLSASVTLDIKKFSQFLYSQNVQPNFVLCCFCKVALVFHVVLENLYMTYYLPIIVSQ